MGHRYFIKKGRRVRMEIDRKGVITTNLRILDNLTDQVRVIPAELWPKFRPHSEILETVMTHRIVETPVQRVILDVQDPDEVENSQLTKCLASVSGQ